jgi:nucleoside-triphosphatase THEP1
MSEKTSRLITIMGLPGVGKSALIRNTLHYI